MRREWESRKVHPDPEKPYYYMGETVRRLGLDFSDERLRLFAGWKDLGLGEAGLHSRPVELKRGILLVRAENGAWAARLQFKTGEIKARIRKLYPSLDIAQVRVLAGSRMGDL